MNAASWFVRRIGHPIWLAYKGQLGIRGWTRSLVELWKADSEVLADIQNKHLRKLFTHAFSTSAYYQVTFNKLGIANKSELNNLQLTDLPFITKEILNHRIDQVLSNRYSMDELVRSSTGGSSGTPLTFYRDRRATIVRRAQDYFFNEAIGINPGDKRAWVWGSSIDAFKLDSPKAKLANFLTERAIYFNSFTAGKEETEQFIHALRSHKPKVIFAYPNMLAQIATHLRNSAYESLEVDKIVVTAEPLYDWQRELFRDAFSATTFERYGSREIGTVAAEIGDNVGMMICEPSYIIEVVDEYGQPRSQGEMGELVVTDLFNYGMPLIRYRTGDMVRIQQTPLGSPSCWRRIVEVGGRIVDLVLRHDGNRISGEALIMALRKAGIRDRVQIVQESISSLRILHQSDTAIAADQLDSFRKTSSDLLKGQVEVKLERVKALRHDKSGKYRYVTSKCKTESCVDDR